MDVKIKKLHPDAVIPVYSKPGDAGLDFTTTKIMYDTDHQITYGTDISIEIPEGYVGLIFPRSSIRKYELELSNSVGVIDCVPAGTMIQTVNGEIAVEDLFNDISIPIYSFNEEECKLDIDSIVGMWIVKDKQLLEITTEDGDVVKLPYDKEVFTKSGWKRVSDLTTDDEILRFN
jgi:hypothetical protein